MNKAAADQTVRGVLYEYLHDPGAYQFPDEHILTGRVLAELNSRIKDKTGVDMSNEFDTTDSTVRTDIGRYVEVFGRNFLERENKGVVKK